MTRVAAIDCGTNSIRMLIAEVPDTDEPGSGQLRDVDRRMEIVRLGQGVDRTGRLAAEALKRTFAVCREYAEAIRVHQVERVSFVATSATRDAENREEFVRGVVDIFGVEPEVITGDQEAELSFLGATKELAGSDALVGPYLVTDIGGGSTELVLGESTVHAARSVDIGCVRLTERHLNQGGTLVDPPSPELLAALRRDVDAALASAAETVPLAEARTLVGLAGSATTVAGIALGLTAYDPSAVHHARISYDRVREVVERLTRSTHAERSAIAVMHPGRVDVIIAGAVILLAIMERTGAAEVVASEHDILDGIAYRAAAQGKPSNS